MPTPELQQADNGTWYIHWSTGRRSKRLSTRQKSEDAAKIFLAHWLLAENAAPGATASTVMVRDLWALYCKEHPVTSTKTREATWRNLEPRFGDLSVAEVTYEIVNGTDKEDGYVQLREKGLIGKPSIGATIRRELVALTACFNWHAHPRRRRITKAEVPVFELPADSEPRDRWLRHPEIQKLLNTAAEMRRGKTLSRGERFLWLALETAGRKTAISELTWTHSVDFETRVIDLDAVPGRVKTKKKRAQVPISDALLPVLQRMYDERVNDFVMTNKADVLHIVYRMAERAGVADVSPNVLRHTAATHMARRGVSLWKIAGILGNSIKMVEKVYAKHCPEGLADAVEMISGGKLEAAE